MNDLRITLHNPEGTRRCGDCQLCCKLLPTKEISKPENHRCPHQRVHVGCTIYARRPTSCEWWSCRWLTNDDTAELRRPDRSHYVIDPIPDHITAIENATGEQQVIPVVQVWCDPSFRGAHRDPALLRFIERRAEEGWATLVRYGRADAILMVAPCMNKDRVWHEHSTMLTDKEHTLLETIQAITS